MKEDNEMTLVQSERNLVSVIVPTRDSSRTIATCLESLGRQRDVEIDIVIVDQESNDGTSMIAHDYGATVVNVKRTATYAPPSRSRNVGFSKSRGNYVLHIDSDMELSSPDLLSSCVSACRSAHAVIIPEIDVGIGFWAECKSMERQCHLGKTLLESPRFFRRETFQALSGYDSSITSGEDWELTDRLLQRGAIIARIPLRIKHHLGSLSMRAQLMKKFSYGKTMLPYAERRNSQMSRRFGSYVGAYARNVKNLRFYIYPVLLMRSIESIGLVAGITLSKTTGEPRP